MQRYLILDNAVIDLGAVRGHFVLEDGSSIIVFDGTSVTMPAGEGNGRFIANMIAWASGQNAKASQADGDTIMLPRHVG